MKNTAKAWAFGAILGVFLIPLFAFSEGINCESTIHVDCGKTPSALITDSGQLWVVFAQADQVYFVTSADMGESYSAPVAVNAEPEQIYANGENRPKIALGSKGEIYVSWTEKTEGRFTGEIRFSRSLDGGKTFSAPITVNNDGLLTSHRFDVLHVSESGKIYMAWLDKRDQVVVREAGGSYSGAALYFAVSENSGESFADNYKVADYSCECCRIAAASYGEDDVAVLWRHIFEDGIRDHAYALLKPSGESSYGRATVDNWKIDACPHHGPDMAFAKAVANQQSFHTLWFSSGDDHKGIYYGLLNIESGEKSQIYSVDSSASASHPQIADIAGVVHVVWKHFDGEKTVIRHIGSSDQGKSWQVQESILDTQGGSDHPLLIETETELYLAWHTEQEGYRVERVY